MFSSRRSNAVANSFVLNQIPYSGTQYRRDERNATENKRRRRKPNQICPEDGKDKSDVTNQNKPYSPLVMDTHLAIQRYINTANRENVGLVYKRVL